MHAGHVRSSTPTMAGIVAVPCTACATNGETTVGASNQDLIEDSVVFLIGDDGTFEPDIDGRGRERCDECGAVLPGHWSWCDEIDPLQVCKLDHNLCPSHGCKTRPNCGRRYFRNSSQWKPCLTRRQCHQLAAIIKASLTAQGSKARHIWNSVQRAYQ
jgi:hypothetical protein